VLEQPYLRHTYFLKRRMALLLQPRHGCRARCAVSEVLADSSRDTALIRIGTRGSKLAMIQAKQVCISTLVGMHVIMYLTFNHLSATSHYQQHRLSWACRCRTFCKRSGQNGQITVLKQWNWQHMVTWRKNCTCVHLVKVPSRRLLTKLLLRAR